MKNTLFLSVLISFILSCNETPETKFERDGVSLTCPKGWAITEEENWDNQGYYLTIEKDGFNSSGLVTITWINNILDLEEFINTYKDELKNNIIYRNSNLAFENSYDHKFNNISCRAVNYSVSLLNLEHSGIIYAFHERNKTVIILKQEANEDKSLNKKGFEIIENSFNIK